MLVADLPHSESVPRWRLSTRIAFRFFFLYFALYVLTTQMLGSLLMLLPIGDIPELETLPPIRNLISWMALHVFHHEAPLVITGSGSGDKMFDWVHAFCILAIAIAGTAIWSALDRRRASYVTLHKWFHLFARFAVGSTMVAYGVVKVVPLQMPYPSLTRLIEPLGHFSPMGVLWYFVGASPAYEIVVGAAELIGGVLLFVPRTAVLGALICLVDAVHIFTLNMAYDVPVKLLSFHLIVLLLILLSPERQRLLNVLVLNRTAHPSTQPSIGRTPKQMKIAVSAQVLFGLYLVGANFYWAPEAWKQYGGSAPKSPLYGIWNVDVMKVDGLTRPALVSDDGRWRRVIFDRPAFMAFQRMDDTFTLFGSQVDAEGKTVTLAKQSDQTWKARFSVERPAPDRLVLDGEMDGHAIRLEMSLVDRNSFLLVNRGFYWVQEYPFNR